MTGANAGTAWSADELERIGAAEELQLASRRADGALGPYVTMWVLRSGSDLFVRSACGPGNPWYRRAIASAKRPGCLLEDRDEPCHGLHARYDAAARRLNSGAGSGATTS